VSTNQQDLEGQREKVVANAIADGYRKNEIAVIEKKESAIKLSEMQRESLNEMKEIINDNPSIESVYVFAIDRLARRVSVVLSIKDYLTERGINLVFLNPHKMGTLRKDEKTGNMIEDELTSMLLMFLSYGAEMEMKIKKERFAAAKEIMHKQNKLTCGKPVFGYRKNADGTVSVNEDEAKVIRQIYYEVLHNDKPIKQIEREMIANGFLKPKKVVTGATVRYYCANKAYYGSNSTCGSTLVYPPIITKDEFDRMQAKMAENRKGAKKNTKQTHLCKGLIRNLQSGFIMIYNSGGRSYVDYTNNQNINAPTMDYLIWHVSKTLYTIYKAISSDETKVTNQKMIEDNNRRIENIKEMIEGVAARQRKAFKAYLDNLVSEDDYKAEVGKIKKELTEWSKEIAKLESDNKRYLLEGEALTDKTVWDSESLGTIDDIQVKKEIVKAVVKEIRLAKMGKGFYVCDVIAKDDRVQKEYSQLREKFLYKVSGHKISLYDRVILNGEEKTLELTTGIKTGESPIMTVSNEPLDIDEYFKTKKGVAN
jgi:DNA invertase Pin-like site-specific DNA recombinase